MWYPEPIECAKTPEVLSHDRVTAFDNICVEKKDPLTSGSNYNCVFSIVRTLRRIIPDRLGQVLKVEKVPTHSVFTGTFV